MAILSLHRYSRVHPLQFFPIRKSISPSIDHSCARFASLVTYLSCVWVRISRHKAIVSNTCKESQSQVSAFRHRKHRTNDHHFHPSISPLDSLSTTNLLWSGVVSIRLPRTSLSDEILIDNSSLLIPDILVPNSSHLRWESPHLSPAEMLQNTSWTTTKFP